MSVVSKLRWIAFFILFYTHSTLAITPDDWVDNLPSDAIMTNDEPVSPVNQRGGSSLQSLLSNPELPGPNTDAQQMIIKFKDFANVDTILNSTNRRFQLRGSRFNRLKEHLRDLKTITGAFNSSLIAHLNKTFPGEIEYVERDKVFRVQGIQTQPNPPNWGLARISQKTSTFSNNYYYFDESAAGYDVNVYVIDTGIQTNLTQFGGRAFMAKSWVSSEPDYTDYNGHGTHVSGIISSQLYGVSKKARVIALKTFDYSGSGLASNIISAIYYAITDAQATGVASVINMSIGGSFSQAMNDAINTAVTVYGIPVFVASGNFGLDACRYSPSSASSAFTVGAVDMQGNMPSWSNYGSCVNMLAPGDGIISLWKGYNPASPSSYYVNKLSGTSQAVPHVTGLAAAMMATLAYDHPYDLYNDVLAQAVKSSFLLYGSTKNTMCYNGSGK